MLMRIWSNMPGKYILAIFVLILFFPLAPGAQHTIVTDRPGQNDSPVTIPRGSFQIETGSLVEITEQRRSWALNNTLFKYGLFQNLEVRLITELNHIKSRPLGEINTLGTGDMLFGVKYQFLNGSTSGGYLGHIIVPSGTPEVSNGNLGMNHHIAMNHQVTEWLSVTWNAGIEYFVEDDLNGLFALSFGFGITDRIGYFTEIYGDWPGFEGLNFYYDHGFTFLVKQNLQLDFSMGTGISDKSSYYAIGASWYVPYQD